MSLNHKTHDKGDLAVALVQGELIRRNIPVFLPLSSACPFDLLAYINGQYKAIQVKFVSSVDDCVSISCRRAIRNGRAKYQVNNDFDILAIYCPNTDECYFVARNEFESSVSLRLSPPKNGQEKHIKFAHDYVTL